MPTANELLDDAKCYISQIDGGLVKYAVLAALIDIAEGNPVPSDPDTLMEEAKCLASQIPIGLVDYTILQAVSGITGGGGSGTQVSSGTDDPPVAPPADPTKAALYYVEPHGTIFSWSVATQLWG
jgi:hypothetical protein